MRETWNGVQSWRDDYCPKFKGGRQRFNPPRFFTFSVQILYHTLQLKIELITLQLKIEFITLQLKIEFMHQSLIDICIVHETKNSKYLKRYVGV